MKYNFIILITYLLFCWFFNLKTYSNRYIDEEKTYLSWDETKKITNPDPLLKYYKLEKKSILETKSFIPFKYNKKILSYTKEYYSEKL